MDVAYWCQQRQIAGMHYLELIGNTTEGDAEEKRHEKLDYAVFSATPAYPLRGLPHLSAFLSRSTVRDVP